MLTVSLLCSCCLCLPKLRFLLRDFKIGAVSGIIVSRLGQLAERGESGLVMMRFQRAHCLASC